MGTPRQPRWIIGPCSRTLWRTGRLPAGGILGGPSGQSRYAYQQNHGAIESTILLDQGRVVEVWWFGMAAPRIAHVREWDSTRWRESERLANAMVERDRRAGTGVHLRPESLNGPLLQEQILLLIERLRMMQEMRSGAIPDWPIPEVASETTDVAGDASRSPSSRIGHAAMERRPTAAGWVRY